MDLVESVARDVMDGTLVIVGRWVSQMCMISLLIKIYFQEANLEVSVSQLKVTFLSI